MECDDHLVYTTCILTLVSAVSVIYVYYKSNDSDASQESNKCDCRDTKQQLCFCVTRYNTLKLYYATLIKKYKDLLQRHTRTKNKLMEITELHFGHDFMDKLLEDDNETSSSDDNEL